MGFILWILLGTAIGAVGCFFALKIYYKDAFSAMVKEVDKDLGEANAKFTEKSDEAWHEMQSEIEKLRNIIRELTE